MLEKENVQYQTFSELQLARIGNIFKLILEYIPNASRDNLLAILFLIQEYKIKQEFQPVVSIDFEVWEQGPVQKDLFADLSGNMWLTNRYLERFHTPQGDRFKAREPFDETPFRYGDVEDMRLILQRIRWYSDTDFENALKGEKSLWYRTVLKHDLFNPMLGRFTITTNVPVDFSLLFDNEEDRGEYAIYSKVARSEEKAGLRP